jgi:hypothetical protein
MLDDQMYISAHSGYCRSILSSPWGWRIMVKIFGSKVLSAVKSIGQVVETGIA